jgi:signal transduction histidine kinase
MSAPTPSREAPVWRRIYERLDSSLRARLFIPTAVLTTLTLGAMIVAAVELHGRDMEQSNRERVQLFATLASEAIGNHMVEIGNRELPELVGALRQHRPDVSSVSILDSDGVVTSSSEEELMGQTPWDPVDLGRGVPLTRDLGQTIAIVRPMLNEPRCTECHGSSSQVNGYLDLRFQNSGATIAKRRLGSTLVIVGLPALAILLAVAWLLLGREAVLPIQGLVDAMQRSRSGDAGVRADTGRRDEFGVAARNFDDTMAALNASTAELQRVHEERMIKADRFSMIGQMATGLAHEIKNPLAGLSGALELLAEDLDDSPQRLEVITEMQHQVTRLEAIMGGLLNFARPPRAQLRTTDVNTSLSKVLFLMGQQRRYSKITVDSRLDPALPPVRADAGQLEQVFLNVCLNAYQAMGEGGGRRTLKSSAAQGQVLVEIADTGPGIPPEVRASIFTPFFTTRSNGTGLGLAMSVRMLAQHGGHLQFDCPEQGGTIFRITLPAEGGAPAA